MMGATELFSHVCGQGRCFVLDGEALPVCQRCLGLYTGAALTGVWLLASGLWRRGLVGRGGMAMHCGLLGIAMVSGLHVVDPGPGWRMMCGLWTGYVAVVWLAGAMQECRGLQGASGLSLRWKGREMVGLWLLPAAFAGMGMVFPWVTTGWYAWSAAALLGIGVLWGLGTAATVTLIAAMFRASRRMENAAMETSRE